MMKRLGSAVVCAAAAVTGALAPVSMAKAPAPQDPVITITSVTVGSYGQDPEHPDRYGCRPTVTVMVENLGKGGMVAGVDMKVSQASGVSWDQVGNDIPVVRRDTTLTFTNGVLLPAEYPSIEGFRAQITTRKGKVAAEHWESVAWDADTCTPSG